MDNFSSNYRGIRWIWSVELESDDTLVDIWMEGSEWDIDWREALHATVGHLSNPWGSGEIELLKAPPTPFPEPWLIVALKDEAKDRAYDEVGEHYVTQMEAARDAAQPDRTED